MRFIHTADIHLGAVPDKGRPWEQQRAEEIWQTFRRLIRKTEQEQADLLLIAGDLFHRQPLIRELKEVNYLFDRLEHTRVVLMAGNHDYLRRDSNYIGFEWADNVIFLDGASCEKVELPEIHTTVYGLSYTQQTITEALYDDLEADDTPGYHILLAHGGDAEHIPMDVHRIAEGGFTYLALGHIHKPQVLIRDMAAYPGALEPIDVNDTGEHGFILGECTPQGTHCEFVPFASRQYMHIRIESTADLTEIGMQERISEVIRRCGREHFYQITLTGYRDPDITYRTAQWQLPYLILEIRDQTQPDYDFDGLLREHADDIVGSYITRILDGQSQPESGIRRQALYLGVQALLDTEKKN